MPKFDYTKKEQYTQQELDAILEQHGAYKDKKVKGFVSPEDYEKVSSELTGFKKEKRNTHISSLVPEKVTGKKRSALLSLSGINDEDTDEQIKKKFESTIKEHSYLETQEDDDFARKKGIDEKEPKPKHNKNF